MHKNNLPTPIPAQPELRALEVFDTVPPGCLVMQILDLSHDPHLRRGEWAVIDPTDREIAWGELYALHQERGPWIWQVVPTPPEWFGANPPAEPVPYLRPSNPRRARTLGDMDAGRPALLADGAMQPWAFREQLIGRVVGVWQPSPEKTTLLRPIDLPPLASPAVDQAVAR